MNAIDIPYSRRNKILILLSLLVFMHCSIYLECPAFLVFLGEILSILSGFTGVRHPQNRNTHLGDRIRQSCVNSRIIRTM